jgi:hemerythrin-like metal-binding protein
MPNRVQWDPRFSVGNQAIDDQHKTILAQCNALGDCFEDDNAAHEQRFMEIFATLKTLAREHFAAEEALLAGNNCPKLEELRNEIEEFHFLEAEIVTTENFDRQELQTFLCLWWTGHIVGNVRDLRPWLDQASA